MRILITGAGGMVGQAAVEHFTNAGHQVFAHTRQNLDIADAESVRATFEREQPETIVNCAAWTDVDGCERDVKRAYQVNAQAVELLARASRRVGAGFVTISTDYVFDGTKSGFYTQRDDPQPTSVYGQAKLSGERLAQAASARTIVIRTGWIFGVGGKNFLSTVPERAQRNERLTAISDAYGTPTYARDLVNRIAELIELDLPGVYHVVNGGEGASYAEFARGAAVVAGCANANIEAVSFASLQRPAPRPQNSRLRCLVSEAVGLPPLRFWRDALADFTARLPR